MTAFTRVRLAAIAGGLLAPTLSLPAQQPTANHARVASARPAPEDGTMFDFEDADVRGVISAIAEAGGLNVGFRDLPAQKYSLHVKRPVGHDSFVTLLRSVVDANGLTMTDKDDLITIAGPPPVAADATKGGLSSPSQKQRLFVYRLRHANATKLAAVLRAIFAGGSLPKGSGGIDQPTLSQSLQPQQPSGGGGIQLGGGGGGQGGGGGIQFSVSGTGGGDNGDGSDSTGGGGNANVLQQLFSGGNNNANNKRNPIVIVPEESTNSLLVRATADDWSAVKDAIDAVDLRPLQVLIEVVIAEVEHTDNLNLGVTATGSNQRTFGGRTLGNASLLGDTSSSSADNFILSLTRYGAVDVHVALAALQARGDVSILSRPLIFAENNVQSRLLVGSQQPFIQSYSTQPTVSTVQNQVVQYRDVGTTLTILPTINPDGYVNLQLQQEVSQATNQVQFGAPVISTREANTSLFVKDGQTVVIGGLAGTQEQVTHSGIPGLSSIPLIGQLFRSTSKTKDRTELFLFLTPHIVQSDSDLARIREEIQKHSTLLHSVPMNPLIPGVMDSVRASQGGTPTAPPPSGGGTAAQPMRHSDDTTSPVQVVVPSGQP